MLFVRPSFLGWHCCIQDQKPCWTQAVRAGIYEYDGPPSYCFSTPRALADQGLPRDTAAAVRDTRIRSQCPSQSHFCLNKRRLVQADYNRNMLHAAYVGPTPRASAGVGGSRRAGRADIDMGWQSRDWACGARIYERVETTWRVEVRCIQC